MTLAELILWAVLIYLSCGVLFAIYFFARALHSFGESVSHSTWGFRIIVIPSMIGLWPFLLRPLFGVAEVPLTTRTIRNIQGFAWVFLLVVAPLCGFTLLYIRPAPLVEAAEVQQIESLIKTSP